MGRWCRIIGASDRANGVSLVSTVATRPGKCCMHERCAERVPLDDNQLTSRDQVVVGVATVLLTRVNIATIRIVRYPSTSA